MTESLKIPNTKDRKEMYEAILPQIESVISHESDLVANMANVASILMQAFNFLWVGFYRNQAKELLLGPFQGPIACTRIEHGKGVCGTAFAKAQTVIVPDVHKFEGHIACNKASKSEIVVPAVTDISGFSHVVFVLDIDSTKLNDFSEVDQEYLEKIVSLLV